MHNSSSLFFTMPAMMKRTRNYVRDTFFFSLHFLVHFSFRIHFPALSFRMVFHLCGHKAYTSFHGRACSRWSWPADEMSRVFLCDAKGTDENGNRFAHCDASRACMRTHTDSFDDVKVIEKIVTVATWTSVRLLSHVCTSPTCVSCQLNKIQFCVVSVVPGKDNDGCARRALASIVCRIVSDVWQDIVRFLFLSFFIIHEGGGGGNCVTSHDCHSSCIVMFLISDSISRIRNGKIALSRIEKRNRSPRFGAFGATLK